MPNSPLEGLVAEISSRVIGAATIKPPPLPAPRSSASASLEVVVGHVVGRPQITIGARRDHVETVRHLLARTPDLVLVAPRAAGYDGLQALGALTALSERQVYNACMRTAKAAGSIAKFTRT